ncbi:MAG: hypothetical protein J7L08_02805 [Candidatus Aenigmarchaeota archaeon]|nr:hypothetical protein [Candidatus Aenigmarchaeota archaeon]
MIFEDLGCCKRCGSSETRTEMLIPDKKIESLKGKEYEQLVEIFCKKCGKINRTKIKTKIK